MINRGNYRRDVFGTSGASDAFASALAEASQRHGWRIHAYVVMSNHYHLALETPEPNLVDGMHWLQSTYATRFNRYRRQRGHLFQGRYQALLVEDAVALARVSHYIHLNPVRAGLVEPPAVATYRWSSLGKFVAGNPAHWLCSREILASKLLDDSPDGWARYVAWLTALAVDEREQQRLGLEKMAHGWAIVTLGWRLTIAQQYAHLALRASYERTEIDELKQARWDAELQRALGARGLEARDVTTTTPPLAAKIALAAQLRREVGASYRWIISALKMNFSASLRMQVHRHLLQVSA